MILARPHCPARERWYAILLLAQGLTALRATAEALERDPHTIGRWASAWAREGLRPVIFEQTVVPPRPWPAAQEELKGAVEQPPAAVPHPTGQRYWRVVRQFVSERFGISRCRSSCLNWLCRLGFACKPPKKRLLKADESKRDI